jgi:hypothetical protein
VNCTVFVYYTRSVVTRAIPLLLVLASAPSCFGGGKKQDDEEIAMPVLRDNGPWITLSGVEPSEAEPGTPVILKGSNFAAARDQRALIAVHFGGKLVKVIRVASDRELIVEAPKGKPGDVVDVHATFDPGGKAKLAKAFTYR